MRRIAQALSGAVALLLTVTGLAHADVAHVNTTSVTATAETVTLPVTVTGANRVLAVGISTVESVEVLGVNYGRRPLTSRIARAAHGTRAEIWTLTAPAGEGLVEVTLSGSATATIGATLFTGVDQADPVMAANAGDADTGATSAVASLNDTTAADGMLGVLALGNVENTFNVRAGGSTDLVTADVRWNEVGAVRAAGATRSGNTGQNMALNAGVNWRWNRIDPSQKNPYTLAVIGLRAGATNAAPTADAGGPYVIDEGSGVTLDASASADPDGDALGYAWDVDGDGDFDDAAGAFPTLTGAQLDALGLGDGPASETVRVRVSEAEHFSDATATLTVANVAPQASLLGDSVVEGATATVRFSESRDASPADTKAGFSYEYDLDGDGKFEPGGATATLTAPGDRATLEVRGAIVDRDGARNEYTTSVEIANAAPAASIAGPATVPSSGAVALTLAASDPGGDALTGTLDWGDGHTEPFKGAGTARHTYKTAGDHTVTLVVRDADGAEAATARHTLSVASLPAPRPKPDPTPAPNPVPTPEPGAPVQPPATGGVAGLTITKPVRITGLAVTPRCIRAGGLRATVASARTIDVRFKLDASAPVRVKLERWKDKRGAAGCPPARGYAKADGKRIAGVYSAHSKRAVEARAGVNTLTLAATDGKGKRLRPGTYLLTVRSGSASARVKLWVLR